MIWPFKRKKKVKKIPMRRKYQAAGTGRLLSDWNTNPLTSDAELLPVLKTLRARSRDLAINNDYARRFIQLAKVNIIGAKGIQLQNKAKEVNGKYDTAANEKIEKAFADWGRKGTCTRCGRMSWADVQCHVLEAVARDGEVLIIKSTAKNKPYGGYRLQIVEADYLDSDLNRKRSQGKNAIKGGVEVDIDNRPVAYHLLADHPGDTGDYTTRKHYTRIPARQVVHLYVYERPGQSRGVPWLTASAYRLQMLGGYEEAELVAARTAASKMGFFTSPDGEGYVGDDYENNYTPITEAEPGTFEQLPTGMQFQSWNPDHPVTAFADFEKAILRGIASGVGVNYVSLANNLEGVSYSSIRSGELSDRDAWRLLQRWFIDNFIEEVYGDWLTYALLSNDLKLPADKFEKFNQPTWQARGWQWVDPAKEIAANIEAVKHGFKSLSTVIGEQGYDIEDVFRQLAREKELAEQYGLVLPLFGGIENGTNAGNNQTGKARAANPKYEGEPRSDQRGIEDGGDSVLVGNPV